MDQFDTGSPDTVRALISAIGAGFLNAAPVATGLVVLAGLICPALGENPVLPQRGVASEPQRQAAAARPRVQPVSDHTRSTTTDGLATTDAEQAEAARAPLRLGALPARGPASLEDGFWDAGDRVFALTRGFALSSVSIETTFLVAPPALSIAEALGLQNAGDVNADGRVDHVDYRLWRARHAALTMTDTQAVKRDELR